MYIQKKKKLLYSPQHYFITLILVTFAICCFVAAFALNTSRKCSIHPVVISLLDELAINNSSLKLVSDYTNISYSITTPTVNEYEIQEKLNTIKQEYNIESITEDFIQNYFGFESEEAFYKSLKQELLSDKKISSIISARQIVLEQLFLKYEFNLDNMEIANYSLNIVNSYENEAMLYNMTLETYCENVLNIAYEDFYDFCYQEGERFIKTYLVIGAIAYDMSPLNEDITKLNYQDIENRVYNYFITAEENF